MRYKMADSDFEIIFEQFIFVYGWLLYRCHIENQQITWILILFFHFKRGLSFGTDRYDFPISTLAHHLISTSIIHFSNSSQGLQALL